MKYSIIFNKTDEEFLDEMKLIAKRNGGKLLSTQWLGARGLYKFLDSRNNEIELTHESLKLGGWYKNRGLVSEPIIRQALEHLFKCDFKKTRNVLTAKILKRKRSLELDGYNENINVAFEYQGHPSHWDLNHSKYLQVSQRDLLKKSACEQLNIVLIQVPSLKEGKNKWTEENILKHIIKAIEISYKQLSMEVPELNKEIFIIDYQKINHAYEKLDELNKIAEDNNGKLLSSKYLGASEKYMFSFQDGRTFLMSSSQLKRGEWPKDPDRYFKLSKNNRIK